MVYRKRVNDEFGNSAGAVEVLEGEEVADAAARFLNQGIGGEPVDIYIHLKPLLVPQDLNDPKSLMLQNYKEKNDILKECRLSFS